MHTSHVRIRHKSPAYSIPRAMIFFFRAQKISNTFGNALEAGSLTVGHNGPYEPEPEVKVTIETKNRAEKLEIILKSLIEMLPSDRSLIIIAVISDVGKIDNYSEKL